MSRRNKALVLLDKRVAEAEATVSRATSELTVLQALRNELERAAKRSGRREPATPSTKAGE